MNVFEASIIFWIQEHLRGALDGAAIFVTRLGDSGFIFILLGLVLLIFRKTRKAGCAALFALLLDFLIVNVTLKDIVARPRPFIVNDAVIPLVTNVSAYRSFPSGHSASAFAASFAVWRTSKKGDAAVKAVGASSLVLAAIVALSRLYAGVHYPTDVLAGCAIGFMCAVWACHAVSLAAEKYRRKKEREASS